MNGVEKQTFLDIVSDKKAGGLIYDALNEIHLTVKEQPRKCDKKYLKRWHAYVMIGVAVGALLAWKILPLSTLMRFIH